MISRPRYTTISALLLILFAGLASSSPAQTTNILYSEDFNSPKTLGWSGSAAVGNFSSSIITNLTNSGFPTTPNSGYLALTANSANLATNIGWYGAQVLTTLSTPNGLGQTNLSKISLTAKVRAKGLPTNGAVAILRIMENGDNAGLFSQYKRVTFEPILLQGDDWKTIGGSFDTAGLTAAKGSIYNFSPTNTSYEITVELSGWNQATATNYVAYNTPTGPSSSGRKNPGLAPNANIRVEFDDVKLAVTDPMAAFTAIGTVSPKCGPIGTPITITGAAFGTNPIVKFNGTSAVATVNTNGTVINTTVPAGATTGTITVIGSAGTAYSPLTFFVTTPTNLLADPGFDIGNNLDFWKAYNGARLVNAGNVYPDATVSWNEDGTPYLIIPGWEGQQDALVYQDQIPFMRGSGDYFTASFRAKFDQFYEASSTIVAFMNGNISTSFKEVDLTEEINQNRGTWHTYTVGFVASSSNLATMTGGATNGSIALKIQPLNRVTSMTNAKTVLLDNVVLSQTNSAAIGPQIRVRINNVPQTDNGTNNLISPLVGKTSTYTVKVDNTGAQDLTISSVNLTGSFTLGGITPPVTIVPGASQSFTVIAAPTSLTPLTGALTINCNDKDTSDQTLS